MLQKTSPKTMQQTAIPTCTRALKIKLVISQLLAGSFVLLITACTPKLTLESELTTQVTNLKDAMKCQHLGNTQISTSSKLTDNDEDTKIADKLLVEVRNIANEVGADTVVPISENGGGVTGFRLYICNNKE